MIAGEPAGANQLSPPHRAARAAAAITDLAARHQVLYFTCHPWTAELLDPGGGRTVSLG